MTGRASAVRLLALAALAAGTVAVMVVLLFGGGRYTVHAQFLNADGLVKGGRVEIAGRKVGSIGDISVSRNGLALVDLNLSDHSAVPLHEGTRASVRAVGQAGLANRYIDLTPGPADRPRLDDGATLTTQQTSSEVNFDALLSSFGPAQRRSFQQLVARSADIYAGSGARDFNAMLRRLSPSTRDFAAVTRDVALDRTALSQLIATAATASDAAAGRAQDLTASLDHMTVAFHALSADRGALSGTLARAPTVLRQASGTLARTATTITRLRPTLREVPAAAVPLRHFLTGTDALLSHAHPAVSQLATQLPRLNVALQEVIPLAPPLTRALTTTGTAMRAMLPTLTTTRLYGTDLILGVFSGLVGIATGPYDARGHYGKLNFIQSPQTATSGPLADLLQAHPPAPGLLNTRTGLTRRCPGGLNPPAPDGSSPWVLGQAYCTPADDMPASVDQP